jgi:hypothetical protein
MSSDEWFIVGAIGFVIGILALGAVVGQHVTTFDLMSHLGVK